MGINIIVKRIVGKTEPGPYDEVDSILEDVDWWDSCRYSGDKDFVFNNDFEMIDRDSRLERPSNFDQCREWVIENVVLDNRKRLIDVLDKMEQDESLCFRWSW